MRHLLVAAVVLVVGLGAYVMTQGSGGGDVLAERDALFEGPVVVEFEAGARSPGPNGAQPWGSYQLTWLADGIWLFEGGESGFRLAHNQHGTLAAYDDGCYVADSPSTTLEEMVFVPGLTVAQTLLQGIEVERDGDIVRYEAALSDADSLRVAEDLSGLASGTILTRMWREGEDEQGTYRISRLDGNALASARAEAAAVAPTDQAMLTVRWRPLASPIGAAAIDTHDRPIFRDCPQLFGFGSHLQLRKTADGWMLENALTIGLPIDAPTQELTAAGLAATRTDVPIQPGTVIIEPQEMIGDTSDPGGVTVYPTFVLEIVACEETDWFRC